MPHNVPADTDMSGLSLAHPQAAPVQQPEPAPPGWLHHATNFLQNAGSQLGQGAQAVGDTFTHGTGKALDLVQLGDQYRQLNPAMQYAIPMGALGLGGFGAYNLLNRDQEDDEDEPVPGMKVASVAAETIRQAQAMETAETMKSAQAVVDAETEIITQALAMADTKIEASQQVKTAVSPSMMTGMTAAGTGIGSAVGGLGMLGLARLLYYLSGRKAFADNDGEYDWRQSDQLIQPGVLMGGGVGGLVGLSTANSKWFNNFRERRKAKREQMAMPKAAATSPVKRKPAADKRKSQTETSSDVTMKYVLPAGAVGAGTGILASQLLMPYLRPTLDRLADKYLPKAASTLQKPQNAPGSIPSGMVSGAAQSFDSARKAPNPQSGGLLAEAGKLGLPVGKSTSAKLDLTKNASPLTAARRQQAAYDQYAQKPAEPRTTNPAASSAYLPANPAMSAKADAARTALQSQGAMTGTGTSAAPKWQGPNPGLAGNPDRANATALGGKAMLGTGFSPAAQKIKAEGFGPAAERAQGNSFAAAQQGAADSRSRQSDIAAGRIPDPMKQTAGMSGMQAANAATQATARADSLTAANAGRAGRLAGMSPSPTVQGQAGQIAADSNKILNRDRGPTSLAQMKTPTGTLAGNQPGGPISAQRLGGPSYVQASRTPSVGAVPPGAVGSSAASAAPANYSVGATTGVPRAPTSTAGPALAPSAQVARANLAAPTGTGNNVASMPGTGGRSIANPAGIAMPGSTPAGGLTGGRSIANPAGNPMANAMGQGWGFQSGAGTTASTQPGAGIKKSSHCERFCSRMLKKGCTVDELQAAIRKDAAGSPRRRALWDAYRQSYCSV